MSQADTNTEPESIDAEESSQHEDSDNEDSLARIHDLPEPSPQFTATDSELKEAAQALADKFASVWDDSDPSVREIQRGTERFDNDLTVKIDTDVAASNTAALALEDTAFAFDNMMVYRSGGVGIQADYVEPNEDPDDENDAEDSDE